jgi:hypothetical protein
MTGSLRFDVFWQGALAGGTIIVTLPQAASISAEFLLDGHISVSGISTPIDWTNNCQTGHCDARKACLAGWTVLFH